MKQQFILFFVFVFTFLACETTNPKVEVKPIDSFFTKNQKAFQKKLDDKDVDLFLLKNKKGMEAAITNYGARLVSLTAPNREGKMDDVVAGFKSFQDYLFADEKYFGATIGRYGNRIANAQFSLDGQAYNLSRNEERQSFTWRSQGVSWSGMGSEESQRQRLELKYLSKDKEENYPGNLNVTLLYELTDQNELKITYKADTDQKTIVNLTHHSFFNLAGESQPSILNHELQINADHYTPVDKGLIPTGEIAEVAGTPFDFTKPIKIGERIGSNHEQIQFGLGYDHNYVLRPSKGGVILAATVYEPSSGRVMEVHTDEPGLQFYSGNVLSGREIGKGGKPYVRQSLFCLETQHFPDSPNHANFPSTVLNPGEIYTSTCVYRFSTK